MLLMSKFDKATIKPIRLLLEGDLLQNRVGRRDLWKQEWFVVSAGREVGSRIQYPRWELAQVRSIMQRGVMLQKCYAAFETATSGPDERCCSPAMPE